MLPRMETLAIKVMNRCRRIVLWFRPAHYQNLLRQQAQIASRYKLRAFERHRLRDINKALGRQNPYPIHGVAANLRAIRLAEKILDSLGV